jgi:hypothetical protein
MIDLVVDDMKESANALPFSSVGAAKPELRFYADASAATRSVSNGLLGRPRCRGRRFTCSPLLQSTSWCR